MGIMVSHNCSFQRILDAVILLCSWVVACLFTQVKIQKESEVRLKIIGTRVDATEIVSLLLFTLFTVKSNFECSFFFLSNFEYRPEHGNHITSSMVPLNGCIFSDDIM